MTGRLESFQVQVAAILLARSSGIGGYAVVPKCLCGQRLQVFPASAGCNRSYLIKANIELAPAR